MEAYTLYKLSLEIEKIILKFDTLIGHAMLTFGSNFILINKNSEATTCMHCQRR